MHAAALIAALLFAASGAAPFVIQDVEAISVAHISNGSELISVWDDVQGDFSLLDTRWQASDMSVRWDGDAWALEWDDTADHCYRVLRTKCWIESYEDGNPYEEDRHKAWFVQLCAPGLKQPPQAPQAN